jgi:hypothetical protein
LNVVATVAPKSNSPGWWVVKHADLDGLAALAVIVGAAAAVTLAPWAVRRLVARRAIFGAETLTIAVLVWVLVLLLALWARLLVALDDSGPVMSPWLAASVVLCLLSWLTTRRLTRQPLVAATGVLTACLVVLVPCLGISLSFQPDNFYAADSAAAPMPSMQRPPVASAQAEVQASYLGERAVLHPGIVQTESTITVRAGHSYQLEATVCGSRSAKCSGLAAVTTTPATEKPATKKPTTKAPAKKTPSTKPPVIETPAIGTPDVAAPPAGLKAVAPISVGARISAWLTPSDGVRISPPDPVIQPVIDAGDHASWSWYVTPERAGDLGVTIHFRVLRGNKADEALVPDTLMQVRVEAVKESDWVAMIGKAAGWLRDQLTWIVGLLGALSITGPMLANAPRRARNRLRRRLAEPSTTRH